MESKNKQVELARIRYSHVETLVVLGIVSAVAVGGIVCLFMKIDAGTTILISTLTLVTGYIGGRKARR